MLSAQRCLTSVVCLLLIGCHRLSPTEQKVVGTWSHTGLDAVDYYIFEANGSLSVLSPEDNSEHAKLFRIGSGRWRVEGNDLVTEIQLKLPYDLPENKPIPKRLVRSKIVELEPDKIVFEQGTPFMREGSLSHRLK